MYKLDYDSSIPLFEQIEQKTRFAIATGEFPEGKIIPAVLEVARAATINHLTVFKAYRHLTDEGLLSPTRGVGFLVVEGAKRRCEKFRQEFLSSNFRSFRVNIKNRVPISLCQLYNRVKYIRSKP